MAKDYITDEGFKVLTDELSVLVRDKRPNICNEIARAAAMGDRSENAEYIYGKKRLREIDRRIRFLEGVIKNTEVVTPRPKPDKVYFGTTVLVEDEDGEQHRYQLVGRHETDPSKGRISWHSPVGRALALKHVGDVVEVQRPKGDMEYEILEISNIPPSQ